MTLVMFLSKNFKNMLIMPAVLLLQKEQKKSFFFQIMPEIMLAQPISTCFGPP